VSHTTTDHERPVADVVEALLGSEYETSDPCDFEAQSTRVAEEVDATTAEAYCRRLLAHLADDPQGVHELTALIVLGLAHPAVLETHRIPLGQEGRRLAHLLERDEQADRAQRLLELIAARSPEDRQIDHELASMMRRTGNADRLVERYMRRAEECVAGDRTKEAISWLQEILLIDRSRRDVARMIRDLRWGDQEKRVRWRSRLRTSAVCWCSSRRSASWCIASAKSPRASPRFPPRSRATWPRCAVAWSSSADSSRRTRSACSSSAPAASGRA
jgi:hypothetical protein